MLSRRSLHLLMPRALLALAAPGLAHAAPPSELFTLARSTNANVIKYTIRLGKDGHMDATDPVDAYWLMLAENGRREPLTWTERQLAYGFSISERNERGFRLRLTACPERELQVREQNGRHRAELAIAKQRAFLQRIFVRAEDHSLLPCVRYVEISGLTSSGQSVSERIVPRRVSRF